MVIVDVLALTSLQRDLPGDVLSRVLGVFDTLVLAGVLLASLATGVLLADADVSVALIAVGVGIPAIGLMGLPTLSGPTAPRRRRPNGCASGSGCCPRSTAGRRRPQHPRTAAAAAQELETPAGALYPRGRRGRRAVDPGTRRTVGDGQRRWGRTTRTAAGDRAGLRRRGRAPARHPAHRRRSGPPAVARCCGSMARTSGPPFRPACQVPRCCPLPGPGWLAPPAADRPDHLRLRQRADFAVCEWGGPPPCCGPNATWCAPASPPSAKPATSPAACAASHSWTALRISRPQNPAYGPEWPRQFLLSGSRRRGRVAPSFPGAPRPSRGAAWRKDGRSTQ